eukprot:679292-Pelagomonas_calceolata.AAC.2
MRHLQPGVARTGAAVVTGHAGEGGWAVAFRFVGVAGTAPAPRCILDGTVGACAAGTVPAVCVGGGAGTASKK